MNHISQFLNCVECMPEIYHEKMCSLNSDSVFLRREKIDHSALKRLNSILRIQFLFLQLRAIMSSAFLKNQSSKLFVPLALLIRSLLFTAVKGKWIIYRNRLLRRSSVDIEA